MNGCGGATAAAEDVQVEARGVACVNCWKCGGPAPRSLASRQGNKPGDFPPVSVQDRLREKPMKVIDDYLPFIVLVAVLAALVAITARLRPSPVRTLLKRLLVMVVVVVSTIFLWNLTTVSFQ